jgi:hypothetical protein
VRLDRRARLRDGHVIDVSDWMGQTITFGPLRREQVPPLYIGNTTSSPPISVVLVRSARPFMRQSSRKVNGVA